MKDAMRWNDRLSTLMSYFLIAGMMTCVAFTIVQIGQLLLTGWDGQYLIFIVFILTLVFMFSQRYLKRERLTFPDIEWFLYHLTEWIIILISIRMILYARVGIDQFWADITSGRESFVLRFFNNEYLLTIFILVMFWLLSRIFADELSGLEGDEKLLKLERDSGISIERKMIRHRMVNLIFVIGGVLVVLTSLLRKDLQARLGFSGGNNIAVYNVLIYFLLGLVLLSLTQFSILRARWGLDKIPVNRNLVTRWVVFTFIFLSGLILLSAILPTGYSLNLLSVLSQLSSFLTIVIGIIIAILSLPLLLIATLLSWLFGRGSNPESGQYVQPMPVPPTIISPPSWIEFIKSLLFWLIFFGVIGFSIYYYFQVNKKQFIWLRKYALIKLLVSFWDWIQTQFRGINQAIATAVRTGLARVGVREEISPQRKPWDFINQGKLTPRQRVILFYRMMLRRGAKSGIPRAVGETPYEYAQTISTKIDALELDEGPVVDVETVTEKFIEARYSTHNIDAEIASAVRLSWERIRRALRQIRK